MASGCQLSLDPAFFFGVLVALEDSHRTPKKEISLVKKSTHRKLSRLSIALTAWLGKLLSYGINEKGSYWLADAMTGSTRYIRYWVKRGVLEQKVVLLFINA